MTPTTPTALDEVLAQEGLEYFERSGDAGDKKYVAAIRATIAALQSAHAEEVAGLRDTLLRNGLVPCDSPGCMCGDWHHRYGWPERFREFTEALENAGHPLTNANGNLALNALSELVRRAEQAEARLAESDKAIDELTAALSEADNENAELEARLTQVKADAKVLAYAVSDNVAMHHLNHDVKCAISRAGVGDEPPPDADSENAELKARLARVEARYAYLRDSRNCSLEVKQNDHRIMYQSVEETLDNAPDYYDEIPDEERARMIATNTIWTIHVYPNTPVGFHTFHAATLDAAIDAALSAAVAPVGVGE